MSIIEKHGAENLEVVGEDLVLLGLGHEYLGKFPGYQRLVQLPRVGGTMADLIPWPGTRASAARGAP